MLGGAGRGDVVGGGVRVVVADWESQKRVLLQPRVRLYVPAVVRQVGLLQYRAQLAHYLFRPNHHVSAAILPRSCTRARVHTLQTGMPLHEGVLRERALALQHTPANVGVAPRLDLV